MSFRSFFLGVILVFGGVANAWSAPQQIHLSWNGPTDSTMTVTWRSTDNRGTVEYGTTTSYGQSVQANSTAYAGSYLHTAQIKGLSPSTAYHYHCGVSGSWSADSTFSTGPAPNAQSSFRFAAWGDTRTQNNIRAQVTSAVVARTPAFSLLTGDLVESGSNQALWDEWFTTLQPLGMVSPLMTVAGNHEGSSSLIFQQFALPTHPTASGYHDESFYSFDYGNVHFVCLSTEPTGNVGGPEYQWLDADLARAGANPNIRWIVALGHRPPYSSGNHGSDTTVQKVFVPLFEKYGVDVAFWGHDHDYERTKFLHGGKSVAQGPLYVVTGGGGAPLYPVGASSFTAFSRSIYHFVEVNVSPSQMKLEARDVHGTVFDTITLRKPLSIPSADAGTTDAGAISDSLNPGTTDTAVAGDNNASTSDAGAQNTAAGNETADGSSPTDSPHQSSGCSSGAHVELLVMPWLLAVFGLVTLRSRWRRN